METIDPLDKELTPEDGISERCLEALRNSNITTLRGLIEKTYAEAKEDPFLGPKEVFAELLDFVQGVKKVDFKKSN